MRGSEGGWRQTLVSQPWIGGPPTGKSKHGERQVEGWLVALGFCAGVRGGHQDGVDCLFSVTVLVSAGQLHIRSESGKAHRRGGC